MMRFSIQVLLAFVLVLAVSSNATADTQSDRYDSKAPAVRKPLYTKKGKHELSVSFGLSTNDAFYQNYYPNVMYNYHATSWLSLGLMASAAINQPTGLTNTLCKSPTPGQQTNAACNPNPKDTDSPGFGVAPDVRRPFFFSQIALEARFAPIYGKLNVFSEAIVHFDFYLLISGGLFLTHPPDVTGASTLSSPDGMGFYPFGGIGIGQRYFLLKWLALRWEFRGLLMPENFKNRGDETRLRVDLAVNIGFSFFF